MVKFIGKLLALLPLILTSGIGLVQGVIKLFKEFVTLVINLVFPFTPDSGKFERFVLSVRDKINSFSDWFEKVKVWLLKITGAKV
jgi:hypothetical protein